MSAVGSVTLGAAGNSSIIPIGNQPNSTNQSRTSPPNIGLCCVLSAGANLTYQVQLTCDANPTDGGNWINHDIIVALTASKFGNIAYAVTAVRLNISAYTSGNVNLGVAQWP